MHTHTGPPPNARCRHSSLSPVYCVMSTRAKRRPTTLLLPLPLRPKPPRVDVAVPPVSSRGRGRIPPSASSRLSSSCRWIHNYIHHHHHWKDVIWRWQSSSDAGNNVALVQLGSMVTQPTRCCVRDRVELTKLMGVFCLFFYFLFFK